MTIQERLHRIGLYLTNPINVLGEFVLSDGLFSLSIGYLLLRLVSVFLLTLRNLALFTCWAWPIWSGPFSCGPAYIATYHEGRHYTYACGHDEHQNYCHSVH